MPWVDPFIDRHEAIVLDHVFASVYHELEADLSCALAGSVQQLAYSDLLGGSADSGHIWLDLAPSAAPQPTTRGPSR